MKLPLLKIGSTLNNQPCFMCQVSYSWFVAGHLQEWQLVNTPLGNKKRGSLAVLRARQPNSHQYPKSLVASGADFLCRAFPESAIEGGFIQKR